MASQAYNTSDFPIEVVLPGVVTPAKVLWTDQTIVNLFLPAPPLKHYNGGYVGLDGTFRRNSSWNAASTWNNGMATPGIVDGIWTMVKNTNGTIQQDRSQCVFDEASLRSYAGPKAEYFIWAVNENNIATYTSFDAMPWNDTATYPNGWATDTDAVGDILSIRTSSSATSTNWNEITFYVTDKFTAPDGTPLSQVYSPFAPSFIDVTYEGGLSVTLTWQAPSNMNGSADDYFTTLGYNIDYRETDGNTWYSIATGNVTSHTFNLPNNNTRYEFRLKAVANQINPFTNNTYANSPWSASIYVSLEGLPTEGEVTLPIDTIDTGIGIGTITNPKPVIVVTPPDESGNVCLKDANGNSLLCAKVPEGSNPNAPLTLRRDGDVLFVIYDGRVVITYQIPAAEFPDLVNSQGWISFYRLSTGFPVKAPTGGTYTPPPINGYTYTMFARNLVQPLGYSSRLWRYGWRYESYDVLVDHDYNLIITELSSEDDINAALYAFRGGYEYTINNVVFSLLIDNGYSHWITGTN